MSIGDFARACGLTTKALRLYDDMGLVRPAEVDEYSGYRYYRADQLERARLVARLRLIGMPLGRIAVVADLPAAARAAELVSYWRQVEADASTRRDTVAALVREMRSEENDMWLDGPISPMVAARTGLGSRPEQLDALVTGTRVHAVADGFGSDPDLAARALAPLAALDGVAPPFDPVRVLDEAMAEAEAAAAPGDESSGCTLTALMLGDGRAAIAHLGDSRVYLVRDGRLERLTRDHTVVQALVDEGRLTEDEARVAPERRVLNRALVPGRSAAPDVSLHRTRPGDRFVLTTDGVHAVLAKEQLTALLVDGGAPERVVDRVEAQVLAAGSPDNYGVVVVDLPSAG